MKIKVKARRDNVKKLIRRNSKDYSTTLEEIEGSTSLSPIEQLAAIKELARILKAILQLNALE